MDVVVLETAVQGVEEVLVLTGQGLDDVIFLDFGLIEKDLVVDLKNVTKEVGIAADN